MKKKDDGYFSHHFIEQLLILSDTELEIRVHVKNECN